MFKPSLKEARTLAKDGKYRRIPVARELFSDFITPITALKILMKKSRHCFLLESGSDNAGQGRYSFLGSSPSLEITCKNGSVKVSSRTGSKIIDLPIFSVIRQYLEANKSPSLPGLPPFTGGFVGYFAYDFLKYSEPSLKLRGADNENFNDLDLMLFEDVICFDHFQQKILLITSVTTDDIDENYPQACANLERMAALLRNGDCAEVPAGTLCSPLKSMFTKETFEQMVQKAKHYIREGDIFQVVLSNRLEAEFKGSLLDTYRCLRVSNPSPYMFYFNGETMELAAASPETLVKLQDNELRTFPLAGTRPRGETKQIDEALEKELLADEKEKAEHNMLVDLGRNDIGKVSKFGSVEVEDYMKIHRYSRVMHIGSTVKGQLRDGCDALDAINAVLPAGTLSGAPKLRAMQIIDELENDKRGIYGGAVGYLDFSGAMDTCIAIRLAYKRGNKVFIRSGAGIVADSVPENEFHECVNKAKAVVEALQNAQKEAEL